jgi:hypothetical protein
VPTTTISASSVFGWVGWAVVSVVLVSVGAAAWSCAEAAAVANKLAPPNSASRASLVIGIVMVLPIISFR